MLRIAFWALSVATGIACAQTVPSQDSPQDLVRFRPGARLTESAPLCAFQNLDLPPDFAVFASGGYAGRKINFPIDQSGHQATQIDVAVNYTVKPVVLMLGAYEPTIWNIGWTPNTRILAVLVSGHHRQAIAGLDPKVPAITSTRDNNGACGYFHKVENNEQLNTIARRLFGRPVDLVYPAPRGSVVIGERVLSPSELVTSPVVPPESFRDKTAPLAGAAGLEEAVRRGVLRPATQADAQAWADASARGRTRDVPPVAGGGVPRARVPRVRNGYVVLKAFEYPAGLYGAGLATFFVPQGEPRPQGNPGHSTVYDFNTLQCQGPVCRREE